MEKKFTPAPWHISIPKNGTGFNTNQGRCIGIYATNDDLEAICQVWKDGLMVHREQDHLANAYLIHAAPDLLQACLDVLDAQTKKEIEQAKKSCYLAINKALNK